MTLLPGAGAVYSGSHSPEGKNQLKISFLRNFFKFSRLLRRYTALGNTLNSQDFLTFYYIAY